MAIIQDADNWRNRAQRSFQTIRGRDMGPGEFEPWIGQDFLHLVEALEDSQEADAQIDYGKWGRTAKNDHWDQQIADANSKVQVLTDERDNVNYPKINAATQGLGLPPDASADSISKGIADLKANGGNDAALQLIIKQKTDENKQLTTNITKLAKENDDLQKQVDSQNPSKLNSFGKQLMALIKKFGLKK